MMEAYCLEGKINVIESHKYNTTGKWIYQNLALSGSSPSILRQIAVAGYMSGIKLSALLWLLSHKNSMVFKVYVGLWKLLSGERKIAWHKAASFGFLAFSSHELDGSND